MLVLLLFSVARTLLFFMTMMIGSVLLHQAIYGGENTASLAELMYAGIFVVTPCYFVFDILAGWITKKRKLVSFVWPVLIGLIVAIFFAYSATRL